MLRGLLLLCLLLSLAAPLQAEEIAAKPVSYPGMAELALAQSEVAQQASQLAARLPQLRDLEALDEAVAALSLRQEELTRRISTLGDMAEWSFERLVEVKGALGEQAGTLKKLQDQLSARIGELDALRAEWSARRDHWQGWELFLAAPGVTVPQKIFTDVQRTIYGAVQAISEASAPLVARQPKVITLLERTTGLATQVDLALNTLRQGTFRKTAPSFFTQAFHQQFNPKLWQIVGDGMAAVQPIEGEFLRDQGWIAVLQLLLALMVAMLIRRYRSQGVDNPEWQFMLSHPCAAGLFVAVSTLSVLYSGTPALWRLGLWIIAAGSSAVLISGLLNNPRKTFMVCLLGSLFILSMALQIISLPQPLYRLYLASVCLFSIPVLSLLAAINRRNHQGRITGYGLSLRLGALVLGAALVAQTAGYAMLASRLVESSVQTVFLALFAAMAVRLSQGGIAFVFNLAVVRRQRFFHTFGDELIRRLKGLLKFLVVLYALVFLLEVWGFYDTLGQAWAAILAFQFTVGEVTVTMEMLVLAGVVLYGSIILSWVLRGLLESEVFPRQGVERGVGDSIRKLLHYCLIFIGFLLAIGAAGVELKHFAVLAGAFGIGIGFGLQNVVNNFVSGLILLFERPVKVGDVVVMSGQWANVRKIGLRSTVVETFDRAEIIVPNSQLISEQVTNWTLSSSMARLVFPVGVAYGSNVAEVLRILLEVGQENDMVVKDPAPSPVFTGFGENSLDFQLRVWLENPNNLIAARSNLGMEIDRRFREGGIEIPFPQRDLHLRSVDPLVARTLRRDSADPL
ncbi:MAG: mechanosensitive ion channel family protein [Trichloromonadaceae bacterium]